MSAPAKNSKQQSRSLTLSELNEVHEIVPFKVSNKEEVQRYKCRVCNCIIDKAKLETHIAHEGHIRSLKELRLRQKLLHLPPPCPAHIEALNSLLLDEVKKASLSPEEAERRRTMSNKLMEVITAAAPDMEMQLFGSLVTGLSIAESDVNLTMCSKVNATNILPGKLITRICGLLTDAKAREVTLKKTASQQERDNDSSVAKESVLEVTSIVPTEAHETVPSGASLDGTEGPIATSIAPTEAHETIPSGASSGGTKGPIATLIAPTEAHETVPSGASSDGTDEPTATENSNWVFVTAEGAVDSSTPVKPVESLHSASDDTDCLDIVEEDNSPPSADETAPETVVIESKEVDSENVAADPPVTAACGEGTLNDDCVDPSDATTASVGSPDSQGPTSAAAPTPSSDDFSLCDFEISYSHLAPPCILLRDKYNVVYKITVLDGHHVESDKLVDKYCQVDPRCRQLAILLRKFARVADIDVPAKGALVGRAFPIMTIFYLQNKPAPIVLPNLQYIVERNAAHIPKDALYEVRNHDVDIAYLSDLTYLPKFFNTGMSQETLAELWLGLLNFYVVGFKRQEYIASITDFHPIIKSHAASISKRLIVQDPISKQNLCHTVSPAETYNFIHNQLSDALMYFSIPQMALRDTKNEKGSPLYKNLKLALKEDHLAAASQEIVGLTTKYIMERSYLKPLGIIKKQTYDFAHSSTVSKDNKRIAFDVKAAVENLSLWMLEYVCLEPPKPSFKIDVSQLDLSVIKDDVDQALRFVRFSMAFCRCAWDRCWSEVFSREQYTISIQELKDFQKQSILRCLEEKLFLDLTHDCSILPGPTEANDEPSEDVLHAHEEETETMKGDVTTEKGIDGEVEDGDEENDGEIEEEILPYNNDVEEMELGTSPTKQCSSEVRDIVFCTKSGWEVTLVSNASTGRVLVDCEKAGFYHANLLKKIKDASQLHFQFDQYILYDRDGLVPVCSSCKSKGHLHDVCPQYMPNLSREQRPALPIPEDCANLLDEVLLNVARLMGLNEKAKADRETTFKNVQTQILEIYPRAVLTQFGSGVNGFGCLTSDLDINLSFPDAEDANQYLSFQNVTRLVRRTETQLRRCHQFTDVQGIRHAKVPIVKFKDLKTGVEGDISFSNKLAVENSKLLKTYSALDEHCLTLGLVLKYLVKKCHIGDASCGSLSSYAYIILLIHYLQQKGYLPVLQEIYDGAERPSSVIDGFDAWFQCDTDTIRAHWSPPSAPLRLSGLWLGFFDYYLYEFKHTEQVATIRQKGVLLKMDKLWINRDFAIEDPFELCHNLGTGLSRKMFCYILSVFNQVLLVHSKPVQISSPADIDKHYFNADRLTMGQETPKDRGCRVCGKIGHVARNCPTNTSAATGKSNKKKDIHFQCIPLYDESQPAGSLLGNPISLLHITPRSDTKFMETQPNGSDLGRDGFVVEPIILDVGGKLVLLPVLTHNDPAVMFSLAERQKPFATRVQETSLQAVLPTQLQDTRDKKPNTQLKKDVAEELNRILNAQNRGAPLDTPNSTSKKAQPMSNSVQQMNSMSPGNAVQRPMKGQRGDEHFNHAVKPNMQPKKDLAEELCQMLNIQNRAPVNTPDSASKKAQPSSTSGQVMNPSIPGNAVNRPMQRQRSDDQFSHGKFQQRHNPQPSQSYSMSLRNPGQSVPSRLDNPSTYHMNNHGRTFYLGDNAYQRPHDLHFNNAMYRPPQSVKNSPGNVNNQPRLPASHRNNFDGGASAPQSSGRSEPRGIRNNQSRRGF